jgi:hypothetical protein
MPHMIELIRASVVPSNIVQSAAKGSLAIPASEMVEILVYLANHNDVFAEQARLTLAGWDEKSLKAVASDPQSPKEVLDYLIAPQNLRPPLLPVLLENPAIPETVVGELAVSASRENVEPILQSARAARSSLILEALASNPNADGMLGERIKEKLAVLAPKPPVAPPDQPRSVAVEVVEMVDAPGAVEVEEEVLPPNPSEEPPAPEEAPDDDVTAYFTEHSDEIAAEKEKEFQATGGVQEQVLEAEEPLARAAAAAAGADASSSSTKTGAAKKSRLSTDEQRGSALQKISKLDVKGRIQLAMKGNKEERSILVRDGTKVVALAVLESPKVTDAEVEMFASQKNVLEALLRGISMKRRFVKNYAIVRNLVSNPRTPLDISLGLIKNLLVNDLKNLSANKDVSDTIRKLALKMYRQKKDPNKKSSV